MTDALATGSVAHTAESDAWRDAVRWALERLSPEQREAFVLRHVEDLSYEQIEAITGTRAAALRMRVLRAREQLRRLLAETVRD